MDKDDISDLAYSIEIGLLNNKSIIQLADQELVYVKESLSYAGKTDRVDIPILKTSIGGEELISFQYRGAFDVDVLVYYIAKGDTYYRISSGRNHGNHFTKVQFEEIRETINNIRF